MFSIYTYDTSDKAIILDRIAAETAEEAIRVFARKRSLVLGTLQCKSNTPYDGCFSEEPDLKGRVYWALYGELVDEGNGPARRAYYRDRKAGLLKAGLTSAPRSLSVANDTNMERQGLALSGVVKTLRRALTKCGDVPVGVLVELVEALRVAEEGLADIDPSESADDDRSPKSVQEAPP